VPLLRPGRVGIVGSMIVAVRAHCDLTIVCVLLLVLWCFV
jgi:hypothetical protein